MGNLKAFLRKSPVGKTKEVYLDRFTDEEGNKVPFLVKAISPGENEEIAKRCTTNGRLDNARYANEMLVACMVEPNFKDSELCKYYGVMDPADVPNAMFTIGEKQILQGAALDINDVNKATKELLEEAKNS